MIAELRNPLNAIVGMSDWLLETRLNSQQREFTQGIKFSSALMTRSGLSGVVWVCCQSLTLALRATAASAL